MKRAATLLSGLLLLAACGQQPTPTPVSSTAPATPTPGTPAPATSTTSAAATQPSLGVYALEISALGGVTPQASVSPSGLSAQEVSGLSFRVVSIGSEVDKQSGVLHLTTRLEVTNTSGQDLSAPAFIPVDLQGGSKGTVPGTALRDLRYFDGSDARAEAPRIRLETAQRYDAATGTFAPAPDATPLRRDLSTAGVQVDAAAPAQVAGLAREAWVGGSLPNGGKALLTFAAQVPLKAGTATSAGDPYSFVLMFTVADGLPAQTAQTIGAVQGATPSGDAPAALTGTQTVEGVVTADFRSGLKGFYVQEPTITADGDPLSSDGIFVYCGTACASQTVNVGDRVRVTGDVAEFSTATQMTNPTVQVLATGQALPGAVQVALPLPVAERERLEGMLVTTSGTVTNNYELTRYGSVGLADSRIYTYTQQNRPSAAGLQAYNQAAADRTITVDDGSSAQNPATVFGRDGLPLSAGNTLRGGDSGTVRGVLTYGFGSYRIQATEAQFQAANPRAATPELPGGDLRVASMNVLNYFNTLDGSNSGCTAGGSGPSRGANDCTEFERQQAKIVAAIEGLNPAVLGVNELENDYAEGANSSAAQLVGALNRQAGYQKYAYVNPGHNVGSDQISVGMLYQPALVEEVGRVSFLDSRVDPAYDDTKNRPAWAQTFQSKANGGRFTLAVAHLKSKGSACATPDLNDGQGNCADVRTAAASALARWLDSGPTGVTEADRLIMGDLNSYAMEDPIMALQQGGYGNLFDPSSYSYQFGGQWGSLDHALATPDLAAQVFGKTKWHINADEPTGLDYNTEFKSPEQVQSYFAADAFRSSDHDPVLLGLNLTAQEPIAPVGPVLPTPTPTDPTPTDPVPTDPMPTNPTPTPAGAGLIISEYVEGSSNNKALELYNAGTAPVNLADYQVLRYSNGKAAADGTISLSGTLNPGATLVIAHSASAPALLALANLTSATLTHNGDDALALALRDGTLVDVFGRIGEDPGTAWTAGGVTTVDATLRRKAGIVSGDADGSNTFDPSAEWDAAAKDDFSGLGVR